MLTSTKSHKLKSSPDAERIGGKGGGAFKSEMPDILFTEEWPIVYRVVVQVHRKPVASPVFLKDEVSPRYKVSLNNYIFESDR